MTKFTGLLLALCINGLSVHSALAQDEKTAMVPLPSLDDFSKGEDGWSFGLGLGVEYETAYEGSDEFGLEVQPAGAVQWRSGDNIFILPVKRLAGVACALNIGYWRPPLVSMRAAKKATQTMAI